MCSGVSVTLDRAFQRTSGPRERPRRKEVAAGPSERRLKRREGQKKRKSSTLQTVKLPGERTSADEMEEMKQTNGWTCMKQHDEALPEQNL